MMRIGSMILRIRLPIFYFLGVVIWLLTIAACENRPGEVELKASLGEASEQYWTNRFVKRDLRAAYDMEVREGRPSFSEYVRKVEPAKQIDYLSIKAKEVKVDKDKGVVALIVEHDIPGIPLPKKGGAQKPLVQNITDIWIYTSEGWRHKGLAY